MQNHSIPVGRSPGAGIPAGGDLEISVIEIAVLLVSYREQEPLSGLDDLARRIIKVIESCDSVLPVDQRIDLMAIAANLMARDSLGLAT